MRLLPREEKFYGLFRRQVEVIAQACQLLLDGARAGGAPLAEAAAAIRDLEHTGDEIIHTIFTLLNRTFITPIDPEDIHNLSAKLDDILDGLEDTVHSLVAYRVDPIPSDMIALAEVTNSCARALQEAFAALEKGGAILDHCIEINRLENEGDRIGRTAVVHLFNHERDPITLIKLKEVYEFFEATIDSCEDVADVLQNVVVKNS
jgi:predicted phosphate transport protein (TIGR00153 family)